MPLACLVGDIDRGGVFASLLGTVELLDPEERDRIRGFCINKFRGDLACFEPGVRMMEERLGKPCLGVVPYLPGLALEEEDSVGLPPVARTGWPASENAPDRRCVSLWSRCLRFPTSLTSTRCARNHLSICSSAVPPSFWRMPTS